jgi:hypothetical protein
MKSDHNYGYFADLSHPNWTGRTLRESIGGEYAREHTAANRIPPLAYVVAFVTLFTLLTANFI